MRTEHVKPPWRGFGEYFNPFAKPDIPVRPNRRLPPVSIPVEKAYYCVNCNTVHTSATCQSCDKGPSVPLARWLKRKEEEH